MDKYERHKRMLDFTSNAILEITKEEYFWSTYKITYNQDTYRFCIARKKGVYDGELPVFIFPKRYEAFALGVCWRKMVDK